MIPREVFKKIKKIQITTSRMVTDVFAGQYQSVFKGKGMEFYEVREYFPGDEIRAIDWNVTARMGRPFVKKFVEERELSVVLLLDASASCDFGSVKQLKKQLATELCSLLAFSAIKNNDKVGLLIFTDKIEKFIPPRKGVRHVLRVIREAIYHKAQSRGTDISLALEYLNRVMKRKSIVFLISDFLDKDFKKTISISNKRHDVVAVTITDPRESELPDVGIIEITDAEKGESLLIDSSDPHLRRMYKKEATSEARQREHLLRSAGVDNIYIRTDTAYTKELIKFFRMRERRQS